MRLNQWVGWLGFCVFFGLLTTVSAQENKVPENLTPYLVQPGDVLEIMVWKEEQLQMEVMVRPDGFISFPLAGEVMAQGKSFAQIQKMLTVRLKEYMPDLLVTVSAKQLLSNKIFVMGKVYKPGEFPLVRAIDVTQALAMAGGVTPFADVNDVKILRRDNFGNQRALPFRYGDIEDGAELKQNILLQSGDSVIVP
ncbi:MAG: polysaccharide export protein [Methylococcaceae bacterium]|nr:polysaccharide export protein [Methylococcaceae bacterium]